MDARRVALVTSSPSDDGDESDDGFAGFSTVSTNSTTSTVARRHNRPISSLRISTGTHALARTPSMIRSMSSRSRSIPVPVPVAADLNISSSTRASAAACPNVGSRLRRCRSTTICRNRCDRRSARSSMVCLVFTSSVRVHHNNNIPNRGDAADCSIRARAFVTGAPAATQVLSTAVTTLSPQSVPRPFFLPTTPNKHTARMRHTSSSSSSNPAECHALCTPNADGYVYRHAAPLPCVCTAPHTRSRAGPPRGHPCTPPPPSPLCPCEDDRTPYAVAATPPQSTVHRTQPCRCLVDPLHTAHCTCTTGSTKTPHARWIVFTTDLCRDPLVDGNSTATHCRCTAPPHRACHTLSEKPPKRLPRSHERSPHLTHHRLSGGPTVTHRRNTRRTAPSPGMGSSTITTHLGGNNRGLRRARPCMCYYYATRCTLHTDCSHMHAHAPQGGWVAHTRHHISPHAATLGGTLAADLCRDPLVDGATPGAPPVTAPHHPHRTVPRGMGYTAITITTRLGGNNQGLRQSHAVQVMLCSTEASPKRYVFPTKVDGATLGAPPGPAVPW